MLIGRNKPTEIERLFSDLGSRDPNRRYNALMAAQELTSDQLMQLVKALEQREKRFSLRSRVGWGIVILLTTGSLCPVSPGLLLLGLVAVLLAALYVTLMEKDLPPDDRQKEQRRPERRIGGRDVLPLESDRYIEMELREMEREAHSYGAFYTREQWHEENLLRVMERAPDSRCIEAVLWLLGTAQGEARARLLAVLQQRLPEVVAEDVREWTALQKDPLRLLLRTWHGHPELTCVILRAMPEIGGTWALATVERLAEMKNWKPARLNSLYQRLRLESLSLYERYQEDQQTTQPEIDAMLAAFQQVGHEASECLPGLWAKIQQEADSKVLLRASASEKGQEQLLRPAGDNGAPCGTQNLLRPDIQTTTPADDTALMHRR